MWSPPTDEELQLTPYTLDDFLEHRPTAEVWDENWDVLHMFLRYMRQWRMSMSGPFGLDLPFFISELNRKGVNGEDCDEWIDNLLVIEDQALKAMRKH